MSLIRKAMLCAVLSLFMLAAGCHSTPAPTVRASVSSGVSYARIAPPNVARSEQPVVAPVAYHADAAPAVSQLPVPPTPASTPADPFADSAELSLPQLIAAVEARNPSLQAMIHAWQAAAERYPQVVSLDDPMFMAMSAPASFDSNDVESAYAFQLNQKFPWFGKRAARGRQARAEADAAAMDAAESRLQLAAATREAFFDYYLARRDAELNAENLRVMRQYRDTAQSKYQASQAMLQDVLQADVELADMERERLELHRMNRVAAARINTLLLRPVDAPLAPPPRQLAAGPAIPPAESLRQAALGRRPDLAALAARVRAEEAALTLAEKQGCPDVEVFGRYDTFWQPASTQSDLRAQVGVNVNLPIYHARLNAAVREAEDKVCQRRAEYEQRVLDIQYEVQSAYEQLEESRQTLELYRDKLLPAAEQNVNEARANYDVNKLSFLALAQAQRQLITMRVKQQEALATYHRRLSELERTIAGPVRE